MTNNHPHRSPKTRRATYVDAIMSGLLDQRVMWSEDPQTVLAALALACERMLHKTKTEQRGTALHSEAYWEFARDECDKLADRLYAKWGH